MFSLAHLTPKQLMFMQMLIEGPIQLSHTDDNVGYELKEMGLVTYGETTFGGLFSWVSASFFMWRLTPMGRLKLFIHNRGGKPDIGAGRDRCPTCGPRCSRGFNS